MRAVAVDRSILEHLVDQQDEESSNECSDLEERIVESQQPAPSMLPSAWRIEWVKRKHGEVREFVDPVGRRYQSLHAALAALSDRQMSKENEDSASHATTRGLATSVSTSDNLVPTCSQSALRLVGLPPKRMRLRSKVGLGSSHESVLVSLPT